MQVQTDIKEGELSEADFAFRLAEVNFGPHREGDATARLHILHRSVRGVDDPFGLRQILQSPDLRIRWMSRDGGDGFGEVIHSLIVGVVWKQLRVEVEQHDCFVQAQARWESQL